MFTFFFLNTIAFIFSFIYHFKRSFIRPFLLTSVF